MGILPARLTRIYGNTGQQEPNSPECDSISEHFLFSKSMGYLLVFLWQYITRISGFFMLVNKQAWEKAGGFPGKEMFKEDWGFSHRVSKAGYRLMLINGLYVYHMKKRSGSFT